ncbi:hypothetical protein CSW50_10075 [Thermus scotoductus]|uniref:TtsA-like Glycoside hydrolase family 108 domain-containing protein n=1 Tax=Thermus scotoductus TaxID=37636 RepID=A0A430R0K8_THESC|nr:glycosyl hydrolase 108 family protein [Thermus scotoductus]RTH00928.1 hypothetical protein CSW50_10075 [Thermus scotoductus]
MEFERALAFVLRWEGGYSDHPDDPGGATNYGITQATYDAWRKRQGLPTRPVREISMDEVRAIYRTRYWDPLPARYAEKDPPLALALFDYAVNSGLGAARRALAAVGEDWRRIVAYRLQHLAGLSTFPTFGRGWTRRVAALIEECARLDPPKPSLEQVRRLIVDGGPPVRVERASVVGDKLYVRTGKEEA